MAKENTTQIRAKEFDVEVLKLQEKFEVKLYATLQTNENGEVHPIIKIADNSNKKMYEQNKSKEGNPVNKEA